MKVAKFWSILIFGLLFVIQCKEDLIVKPKGQLRLTYPKAQYTLFNEAQYYKFQYNQQVAQIVKDKKNKAQNYDIYYPKMKARIYLSYYPINRTNFSKLINDHYHLIDNHTIKASSFKDARYEDLHRKVYGVTTKIGGESACNMAFYITDSTKHFVSGALYFKSIPKPDSLKPAIDYIEQDIKKIYEKFEWK